AARPAGADKRLRAWKLRRHRRGGDAVGVSQVALVLRGRRRPQRSRGMTAARLGSEVGPVEMSAENPCAAGAVALQPPAHVEKGQVLFMASDRRRGQQTCRTMFGVRLTDSEEALRRAIRGAGAGAA